MDKLLVLLVKGSMSSSQVHRWMQIPGVQGCVQVVLEVETGHVLKGQDYFDEQAPLCSTASHADGETLATLPGS